MQVHLPREIGEYEPELRFMMELMIKKLYVNRHKGFVEDANISSLLKVMAQEMGELESSLSNQQQFEAIVECADVANVVILLAIHIARLERPEFTWEAKERNGK